MKSGSKMLAT